MNGTEAGRQTDWHALDTDETVERLGTDGRAGLAVPEAGRRLARFGPNRLHSEKKTPVIVRLLAQFNDFMVWVLLAAVLISGLWLKEYLDAAVILAIVLLNAVMGFAQEERAEKALDRLKALAAPAVKVVRDGSESRIPALDLVPGDLLSLEAGDLVAADARLVETVNLMVNESSLTGESAAAEKDAGSTCDADAALGNRCNMVFAGTHVQYGRGSAVVVETGQRTQLGHIASMLEESGPIMTPLQAELRDVGRRIVYLSLFVVAVVFTVGMIRGNSFASMLLIAVSLAVAAIPEGLPAIVTVTLAQGTQAMAKQNAIIRNLPAVETLGCANYICSDKTGTLTVNRMTVTEVLLADGTRHPLEEVLGKGGPSSGVFGVMSTAAALCNDARRTADGVTLGDPTEVALMEAAELAGVSRGDLEDAHARVAEIPFDSNRKMMTTVHRDAGGYTVYVKGAVESLLERSDSLLLPGGSRSIEPSDREAVSRQVEALGALALRTIGVALRRVESLPPREKLGSLESGLTFLGAFAMKDPPRPEVRAALELCSKASIDVAMITGDHRATAESVAAELGILTPGMRLIEGPQLEEMTPEELAEQVEDIRVYARVSPRHKVTIVEALRERGHVVAMTGDGVNDAPALKRADIGVAMGITGTDVSKEAADMILADDNFATIVAAVRQGRIIFSNLKKFIYFLLSCNISEVFVVFVAMLAGFPLPLLPAQILWINLVTDGLPALALGVDPPEKDVMEHPPRRLGENILEVRKQLWLAWQGALITAGALTAFMLSNYLLGYDWAAGPASVGETNLDMARTVLFTTLVFAQVFHALNMRSETRSFFLAPPWENRYLAGSLVLSLGLQMAVLYAPFMQKAFRTSGPSAPAWLLILCCAAVPVLAIDRIKAVRSRRARRASGRFATAAR